MRATRQEFGRELLTVHEINRNAWSDFYNLPDQTPAAVRAALDNLIQGQCHIAHLLECLLDVATDIPEE